MIAITSSLIEDYLQRKVTECERASIHNLNEVPVTLLQTMSAWPRPLIWMRAPRVLRFFVAEINEEQALAFADEVIAKGESASGWRNGNALYFKNVSLWDAHLTVVAEMKSRFDSLVSEGYFAYRHNTIGVLVVGHRYWNPPPFRDSNQSSLTFGVIHCVAEKDLSRIQDDIFACEIRRRIASNVALHVGVTLTLDSTVETVIAALRTYPAIGEKSVPSDDGLIAIRALIAESQMGSPDFPSRAGFIGPDDWYR